MSYPTDVQAREEIIRIGRLLYEEGLNTGTDGNISCRWMAERVCGPPAQAAPRDFSRMRIW